MAAKRIGSVLTNVTGTSGQLLRVKSDESGFEFYTPATIPSYSVTNKTIDRAIDCIDTNIDELANIVGTLIDDLAGLGANGATSGVYVSDMVLHTGSQAGTLYTITHNLGSEPDYVQCQYMDNQGRWVNLCDYFSISANNYGWQNYGFNNSNVNISKFYVYRFDYGAGDMQLYIRFICAKLGVTAGTQAFQWSTSEQVYPFEKASDGSTLYCKEINFGAFPNGGNKSVAHGISGLVDNKVFNYYGMGYATGGDSAVKVPYVDTNPTYNIHMAVNSTTVVMSCNGDFSTYSGIAKVIYAK
jgi:hypothetical protein